MTTISISQEDYELVAQLAGRMQMVLKKKISLGRAAGHACRYVLSETKRIKAAVKTKRG